MSDLGYQFDFTARLLHWLSVMVILWATLSGFYVAFADVSEALHHGIADFNVAMTTLFIPFFAWRMVHRFKHGAPGYNGLISPLESKAAKTMHILLYAQVFVVLVSGVLMMDRDINLFNLVTLPQPISYKPTLESLRLVHEYTTRFLALSILFHVAAVIKHEWSGRRLLRRML